MVVRLAGWLNRRFANVCILVLWLQLLTDEAGVVAFPNFAGACPGGVPAVGGSHLWTNKTIWNGTLAEMDVEVVIQGQPPLDPKGPPVVLQESVDYTISVNANGDRYRGLLIRLEAPKDVDTEAALLPGSWTQVANACQAPVVGVCHTNRTPKRTSTATLRIDDDEGPVFLDITVVKVNDEEKSSYFYNRFELEFQKDPVPTVTPAIPTSTPTIRPATPRPTTSPTGSPILQPTPTKVCISDLDLYDQCVSANWTPQGFLACELCVSRSYPQLGSSCDIFNQALCPAIRTNCECSPCETELVAYTNCLFTEISLDCQLACNNNN